MYVILLYRPFTLIAIFMFDFAKANGYPLIVYVYFVVNRYIASPYFAASKHLCTVSSTYTKHSCERACSIFMDKIWCAHCKLLFQFMVCQLLFHYTNYSINKMQLICQNATNLLIFTFHRTYVPYSINLQVQ